MVINMIIDFLQGIVLLATPIILFTAIIGVPFFRIIEARWPERKLSDIVLCFFDGLIGTSLVFLAIVFGSLIYYLGSKI